MIAVPTTSARPLTPAQAAAVADHEEQARAALAEGAQLAAGARALLAGVPPDYRRWEGLYLALDRVEQRIVREADLGAGRPERTPEQAAQAAQRARRIVDELRAQIERHRAPLEAAREAQARDLASRRELAATVAASIDPALAKTHDAARAARGAAKQQLAQARARLEEAERTPPPSPADLPAWARQVGLLRDEVAGYQLLADRARAAAEEAEQRHGAALAAAWDAHEGEARALVDQVEADGQAAIAAAERAVEAARQALQAQRQLAGERLSQVQQARTLP